MQLNGDLTSTTVSLLLMFTYTKLATNSWSSSCSEEKCLCTETLMMGTTGIYCVFGNARVELNLVTYSEIRQLCRSQLAIFALTKIPCAKEYTWK